MSVAVAAIVLANYKGRITEDNAVGYYLVTWVLAAAGGAICRTVVSIGFGQIGRQSQYRRRICRIRFVSLILLLAISASWWQPGSAPPAAPLAVRVGNVETPAAQTAAAATTEPADPPEAEADIAQVVIWKCATVMVQVEHRVQLVAGQSIASARQCDQQQRYAEGAVKHSSELVIIVPLIAAALELLRRRRVTCPWDRLMNE